MSQVPTVTESVAAFASASSSEKSASSPAATATPSLAKVRSCVVCRRRKVRCDKQSPCSNCRRANFACVFPSTDRPPRWARRREYLRDNAAALDALALHDTDESVDKLMDRLRNLENLVKELSGQQEQAHVVQVQAQVAQNRDAEHQTDTSPGSNTSSVQKQFGRLVLQDASRSRYVSSGFWSRVNDELDGLKTDAHGLIGDESDSSEDEASPGKTTSTQELERTPSQRHAFLFRHNLNPSTPDLHEFHPLPSQIPFLLDVFSENVNLLVQIVHMPTVTKMARNLRDSGMTRLTPANEALMFSIYYAAITSMEEDDVMTNFGSSKIDLNLKYRLGLEHALAKADFLNKPDLVLVQAFAIFLLLVRRHDSPRFVWMMTGMVIRMAQYLGLQRDGTHFEHLTPFEIEMRRRVWWAVSMIDMRASEDQGTDLTIVSGSYDTKIPLNINNEDIDPNSKQMPIERDGVTDMTFLRINVSTYNTMRQMMALDAGDDVASLEEQSRHLLNEIYQKYELGYFQYTTELGNIVYWVTQTIARLVMAKMTLIVFLPVLFSSPSEHFSNELRTKLLVSAIEVAEYNHALNAEQACRKWRWIYQTYTHWHAIVYLMIEISRRPWSSIVERAWVALHSSWLIPAQIPIDKNLRIWVPLRKLIAKARKHREAELSRLRADPQAATKLEMEDQKIPLPSSSGLLPTEFSVDIYHERWRELVDIPKGPGDGTRTSADSGTGLTDPSMRPTYKIEPNARPTSAHSPDDLSSSMNFESTNLGASRQEVSQTMENTNIRGLEPVITTNTTSGALLEQPSLDPFPTAPADWSDGRAMGLGFVPWLWADTDPSVDMFSNLNMDFIDVDMNVDSEVNWYNWVASARGI